MRQKLNGLLFVPPCMLYLAKLYHLIANSLPLAFLYFSTRTAVDLYIHY